MSQTQENPAPPPLFTALTTSSRQILTLLKCIGFQSKAQLQISADGLRVTVEDSHVMQGHAFIDKNLFTTYTFHPPPHLTENLEEDEDPVIQFGISLTALLECLQIFGGGDAGGGGGGKWRGSGGRAGGGGEGWSGGTAGVSAFDHSLLRIAGTCRFLYEEGGPLCLILEESPITTTCELTTYTPAPLPDIPLSPTLTRKIILKSSLLYDAITELSSSSTHPSSSSFLVVSTSPTPPHFTLSSTSPLGTTTVEFSNDGELLETFMVSRRAKDVYRFDLVRHARGAMAVATKVSVRSDQGGVLSLQFMVEWEGRASFVDFRFLGVDDREGGGGGWGENAEEEGEGEEEEGEEDDDDGE